MRASYLTMIRAFAGGWDAMAAALGWSRQGLENRIYELKGQSILVETALQMQAFSNTTHFAEAVAKESGGVFLRLPEVGELGRDDLLDRFNEVYAEIGEFSAKFREAVRDNEIDRSERHDLEDIAQQIHRSTEELLALTFQVYCRDAGK